MPFKPVSDFNMGVNIQLLRAEYLSYILYKSPANKAASSPPVPALISKITFFSSASSFGNRASINSLFCSSKRFSYSGNSFLTISLSSSSFSFSKISLYPIISFSNLCISFAIFITGSNLDNSLLI